MTEYEIAVIDAAMRMAAAQHALDCGTPAQAHLKRTTTVLLDVCADLSAEYEGEWSPEMASKQVNKGWPSKALLTALEDAIAVTESCKRFHDEQADRAFQGNRPDWRKSSSACFDEIDGKPGNWRTVAALARGIVR